MVENKNKTKKTKNKKREKPNSVKNSNTSKSQKSNRYFEGVGRRKQAVARVRLYTKNKKKEITVNGKDIKNYFPLTILRERALSPIKNVNSEDKFSATILIKGGGISAQADACSLGVARALCLINPLFRKNLKKQGLLTRDPRKRERKKYGLKRARRAAQWSKR